MDLGLKEIGTTLIVGAFTIFGIHFVLYKLLLVNILRFFQNPFSWITKETKSSNESSQLITLIVFIGFSFGIGILAEDLSYRFVDNELPFGLETKIDYRITLLVEDFNKPKINPLAVDLAKNNAFVKSEPQLSSPSISQHTPQLNTCPF